MVPWILLLALVASIGFLSLFYLITRVRRFSFMRRLSEKHKALSWFLAAVLVGLLFLFAFINVYSVVIIIIHLALIWLLCDLIAWIIRLITKAKPERYYAGIAAILLTVLYLGTGWIAAHQVRQTDYTVSTDKNIEPLRIALIADSHLGVTLDGTRFAEEVERIGAANPDLVVIVGDYVDDDSKKVDMLEACRALGSLKTTYGSYYVFGNHDAGYYSRRDFTTAELRQALTENGVIILEDETVPLGENYVLAGRKDRSSRDRLSAEELLDDLSGRYVIVLDHQPNDYDSEAAAGADLVLSGHTHGGHMFPAGLIGLWMKANDALYGLSQRDDTTFIITSGISGWAIPFKTGAFSEYVIIDIVPSVLQ